jgi:hypothetical protein
MCSYVKLYQPRLKKCMHLLYIMESTGSRNSRIGSTTPGGRSKKIRSAAKRKGNASTLPADVFGHVASFLHHPVNKLALRQTSSAIRDMVSRHPTKQNALRALGDPKANNFFQRQPHRMYPAAQNRFIMNTSGRRYMNHDQARKYLENMFTHKGNGDLFKNPPVVFPGMYGSEPTDHQRLALARAITADESESGIEFMYKLIQKIIRSRRSRYSAVHALSPQSLAHMYTKRGPGRKKVLSFVRGIMPSAIKR